MRKRDLKLKNIGISKKRIDELSSFCGQYGKYLEESKNTWAKASRKKIEMISDSAEKAVGSGGVKYIIANICEGKPFSYLQGTMGIPMSKAAFYDCRKVFFLELDRQLTEHFEKALEAKK